MLFFLFEVERKRKKSEGKRKERERSFFLLLPFSYLLPCCDESEPPSDAPAAAAAAAARRRAPAGRPIFQRVEFFSPSGSRLSCSSLQIETASSFLTFPLLFYSCPYLQQIDHRLFLLLRGNCWLARAGAVFSPAREALLIDIPLLPHWTIASRSLGAPRETPAASPIARNRDMLID